MDRLPHALFVACDAGPRETLAPLARGWGTTLEDNLADSVDAWAGRIAQAMTGLVVTGASDSAKGQAIEAAARIAARRAGVPLAAVEDYPGNYRPVAAGDTDLLLVESAAAMNLARRRLGERCPRLLAVSPARFDTMRLGSAAARAATHERWRASQARNEPAALLWIGQPETADGVATLAALLPAVRAGGWRLFFRAHPRDAGYAAGAYGDIARELGSRFEDVTALDAAEVFALAPRLALTQFSSMVVEAGFHGIPSLCLLFPGAGRDRFKLKKGYPAPIACTAGAVGLCVEAAMLPAMLQQLLEDESARHDLLSRFDDYFAAGTITTTASVQALKALTGK